MGFLRNPAPDNTSQTSNDVTSARESLVKNGLPPRTIDVYVEKQLKWAEAQAKWDAVRKEATGKGKAYLQIFTSNAKQMLKGRPLAHKMLRSLVLVSRD
jgi:hypothetical protein